MPTRSHALDSATPIGISARDRLFERGDALGRYEVLLPLASTGRHALYAARVRGAKQKRAVALKVMQTELANDATFNQLIDEETLRAVRVVSPSVVSLLEPAQRHEQTLYVPMELVLGVSARELFEAARRHKQTLAPSLVAAILVAGARGLSAIHRAGLVHGDMSAQTLLIGIDGGARVADFGMTRSAARASALYSDHGLRMSYASPEQMRGDFSDPRSDSFSLAVIGWELLSGERLFDTPNPLTTAERVASLRIPRLDDLRGDVPEALAQALARALERDPDARFDSAERFADAIVEATRVAEPSEVALCLRTLCQGHVTGAERALARAMKQPEGARASDTSSQRVITRVRTAPRRDLWVLLVIMTFVAMGSYGMWRLQNKRPEAQVARASAARDVPEPNEAPVVAAPAVAAPVAARPELTDTVAAPPSKVEAAPAAANVEQTKPEKRAKKHVRKKHHRARAKKKAESSRPVKMR